MATRKVAVQMGNINSASACTHAFCGPTVNHTRFPQPATGSSSLTDTC